MKRTILIPLLLSTFLLVGCSQEPTELERCIEANGGNVEFDLAQYLRKGRESSKRIEDGSKSFKEALEELKSSYTPTQLDFYNCTTEKVNERMKELEESGLTSDEVFEKVMEEGEEIQKYCLPMNRAKAICYSQGIY